jgi:hypothetical protein
MYWTAETSLQAGGMVGRVPLVGGSPSTLAAGLTTPVALCADEANAYLTNSTQVGDLGGVVSVPLDGGPVSTLASQELDPSLIAVDSTSLYWSRRTDDGWALMKLTPK